MNNKTMMIIVAVLLAIATIYSVYAIFSNDEDIEEENNNTYVSELIEDECTEEYKEEQEKATTVSTAEEKIATNSQLILKKYYAKCEHTINEYVEMPEELVNMTEEEVKLQYPDWEVIGFEPNKVTLYKEFDDVCGEHFKLRVEEGKVVIYLVNQDGTESLDEQTDISSEYLTETDLINMQDGLEIFGKEELNKIIEDFE